MQHRLLVENIQCYGCAEAIELAVAWIPGVSKVEVEIRNRAVWFDGPGELLPRVRHVLARLGYPVSGSVDALGHAMASVRALGSCEIGRKSGHHGSRLPPPVEVEIVDGDLDDVAPSPRASDPLADEVEILDDE